MHKLKINKTDALDVLREVIISVAAALILMTVFVLILQFTPLSGKAILPVNIAIKIIALLLGAVFGIKNPMHGIIKGVAAGALFTAVTHAVFSLLEGSFIVNALTVYDVLFSVLVGVIANVIAVNIKK